MAKKRNGKIEFYRFIMCFSVLMFHLQKYFLGEADLKHGVHPALFPHGAGAVEFFFLLSGFLMAKSIYGRIQRDPENANRFKGSEGLRYIWNKYVGIFPYHLVAFFMSYVSYCLLKEFSVRDWILKLIDSVPSFLMIQMSGASFTNPNHVEWYISAMFLAMLIVYPFLRRFYEPFARYIGPLVGLLILGYLLEDGDSLSGVMTWTGIAYRGTLRAVAEIALGASAFEASRALGSISFSEKQRKQLTALEVFFLIAVLVVFIFTFPKKYEFYGLMGCYALIVLAFAGVTNGENLFDNQLVFFLGKITLPIYLAQVAAIEFVQRFGADMVAVEQILVCFILTCILAAVIMVLGDRIMRCVKKHSNG